MNLASPPLTSAVKTQRIALGIALGMMLLVVIYLLVSIFNADGTSSLCECVYHWRFVRC